MIFIKIKGGEKPYAMDPTLMAVSSPTAIPAFLAVAPKPGWQRKQALLIFLAMFHTFVLVYLSVLAIFFCVCITWDGLDDVSLPFSLSFFEL